MNKLLFLIFIPTFIMAQNNQPIATKQSKKLTAHNHTRIDDYYWMNERDSKPVLDYISLENKHAEAYFAPLNGLVDGLMKEFDQRINPNEISAPFILNGKTYQVKNLEGKDYQQILHIENGKSS